MLPMVVDPFGFGKNWLLMIMAMVGMLVWAVELLVRGKPEIKTNKALVLLLVLAIWAWLSWWFRLTVGERMRSIIDAGGVGTLTAVVMWFFLWLQVDSREERQKQLNWLTVSGILVMLVSMVVFLWPSSKLPIVWPKNNPMFSIGADWSLAGSLLSEGVLMLFLVLEWGRRLLVKLKSSAEHSPEENNNGYILEAGVTALLVLALMLDIFRIFKIGWVNLDGVSAWVIAVEVFKRNPIWGAGIGNFVNAFAAFRPESYNLTKYWTNGFRFSSMGILQLWTELGIVGLTVAALLTTVIFKLRRDFGFIKVAMMGLIAIFLPFNVLGTLLLVWLLAGVIENKKINLSLKVGENGFNLMPWLLAILVLVVNLGGGYWLARTLLGEVFMRQSLVAASKNDGGGTYNLQIKAIGMNPYLADYRRVYSQTNLSLAGTILANKEMSDDDKQKASVLVQQAAREAKAAISLEPNNSVYWENLAAFYRQIVGIVPGSADWSFQAYQQAVVLDPVNPISKLEMGGLLFAANRFDEADRVFEQVVTVKPDFANGWYNWAYSAKKTGRLADAVARLSQALSLVPVDSGDYDKASKELMEWKKELDAVTAKATAGQRVEEKKPETLKTEQPLPTGTQKDQVAVPNDELAPPVVENTPASSQGQ